MPRDGSGVYSRPPGTDGVPGTTISSARYNADVADVETDLNHPRPIVAGGTGAATADGALFNLGAYPATGGTIDGPLVVGSSGSPYALQVSGDGSFGGGLTVQGDASIGGNLNINDPIIDFNNITFASRFGGTTRFFSDDNVLRLSLGDATVGANAHFHSVHQFWNAAGTVQQMAIANDGSMVVGNPTGGPKGYGTVNASAFYDDNVFITCFGIEFLKNGYVNLAQWDEVAKGKHALAHQFVEMLDHFDPREPDAYIEKLLHDEALPGMPTLGDWKHNAMPLGELASRLWLAVELLASAYVGTHKRLQALEERMGV